MLKKLLRILVILFPVLLNSCNSKEDEILGTWQRQEIVDGGVFIETLIFFKSDDENYLKHTYEPPNENFIGSSIGGNWDIDEYGDLYIMYDLKSIKPIYDPEYISNKELKEFIRELKTELKEINQDSKNGAFIKIDISDNKLSLKYKEESKYFEKIKE